MVINDTKKTDDINEIKTNFEGPQYTDYLDGKVYHSKLLKPSSKATSIRNNSVRMSKMKGRNNNAQSKSLLVHQKKRKHLKIINKKLTNSNSSDDFFGFMEEDEPCTEDPSYDELAEMYSDVIDLVPKQRTDKKTKSKAAMLRHKIKTQRTKNLTITVNKKYQKHTLQEKRRKYSHNFLRKIFFKGVYQGLHQTSQTKTLDYSKLSNRDLLNREVKLNNRIEEKNKTKSIKIQDQISFPLFYHSVGTIRMPIDDIEEPFEAWYAGLFNMSRIDYYYGMDKTYQRGDLGEYGMIAKISPVHLKKNGNLDSNTVRCRYSEAEEWSRRRGQTVIPYNISKYEYAGLYQYKGVPSYKFQYYKRMGHKNNTYILHVTKSKPHRPLRYEMIGYDHILLSHYDHYILEYYTFDPWKFDFETFRLPKELHCVKHFPETSKLETNPMWDFVHEDDIHHRDRILNQTYDAYKKKHKKKNTDEIDNHRRKNIFHHNLRFVHSRNRARLDYKLDLNHLSDLYDEEFNMMRGPVLSLNDVKLQKELNDIPHLRIEIPRVPPPKNLDWRDYGAVTKVKAQSFCASCWAHATAGVIEGAYALKYGNITDFSVQQLVDCSWAYKNNGCRGGWPWRAFKFINDHGLATQATYGKYLAQEGICHCDEKDKCNGVQDKLSYKTIERRKPDKTKLAIATFGPGTITVFCRIKSFKFYSSGIYDDIDCDGDNDHSALLIGYGEENGKKYWLLKNSWGRLWGDNGYMKISMKNDLCGVLRNGVLMVSFDSWANTKLDQFPFSSMVKQRVHNEEDLIEDIGDFKDEIDFYHIPETIASYLEKSSLEGDR